MNKIIVSILKAWRDVRLWELNSYLQDDPKSLSARNKDAENAVYNLSKSITYYRNK